MDELIIIRKPSEQLQKFLIKGLKKKENYQGNLILEN